jgi:hypothetical protein
MASVSRKSASTRLLYAPSRPSMDASMSAEREATISCGVVYGRGGVVVGGEIVVVVVTVLEVAVVLAVDVAVLSRVQPVWGAGSRWRTRSHTLS